MTSQPTRSRASGPLPDDIEILPATVFVLEQLNRIVGLGMPPAKRLAEATAAVKKGLGVALVGYLDDRCQPDEALPPQ